jgi:hypothetical protein
MSQHPTKATASAAWFMLALQGVRRLAATGEQFQCHDLVTRYGVPEPPDHHQWGLLMRIARADGLVVPVGAVASSRPKTAHSLCKLWVGAQNVAADGAA